MLVVVRTTKKTTISIHRSISQKIKSWDLKYLSLFLSFFSTFFYACLSCLLPLTPYFSLFLFLPYVFPYILSPNFFLSLPLSHFLSLYVIFVFLLSIPSLTITLSLFATGFCLLPFLHPLYIIWFFLITVKLTFSFNTLH